MGLVAGSAAQAGHYDVTYGGTGAVHISGGGSTPYVHTVDDYFEGAPAGVTSTGCKGTVIATFTWVADYPGEPTPAEVIVKETCEARVAALTPGTVANGLGDAVSGGISGKVGSTLIGHYEIKPSPGASFTWYTRDPKAIPAGSYWAIGVKYKALVIIPKISLSGGAVVSNERRYMTGQKCSAVISGTGDLNVTTWDWNTSGATPFAAASYSSSSGQRTTITYPQTGSGFAPYYADAGTPSITCAIHLGVPVYSLPTAGLNMTLSKSFPVYRPTVGTPAPVRTSVNILSGPTLVYGTASAEGITFTNSVALPASYPNVAGEGEGIWHWVQTINVGRSRTTPSGTQTLGQLDGGTYYTAGLDSTYPYAPPNPNAIPPPGSSNYHVADGSSQFTFDSPRNGLSSPGTVYTINEPFKMYVMYKPPGTDSVWVPVHQYDWSWGGTATLSGGTWSLTGATNPLTYNSDSITTLPTWNRLIDFGTLQWH